MIAAGILALVLFLALVGAGGRWLLSRSYYVGVESGQVVIYQGIPTDVGPFSLSWVHEETDVELDEVSDFFVDDLEAGLAAVDLEDAHRIVEGIPRKDDPGGPNDATTGPGGADPGPDADATTTP